MLWFQGYSRQFFSQRITWTKSFVFLCFTSIVLYRPSVWIVLSSQMSFQHVLYSNMTAAHMSGSSGFLFKFSSAWMVLKVAAQCRSLFREWELPYKCLLYTVVHCAAMLVLRWVGCRQSPLVAIKLFLCLFILPLLQRSKMTVKQLSAHSIKYTCIAG